MVTDGSYSEYSVCGIYSTIENAEIAKKIRAADNAIVEIEMDDFFGAPTGMFWYEVDMDKNGNTKNVQICDAMWKCDDEWKPCGDDENVVFNMWAKDESHAVKIANERRIRLVESNLWNTSWEEWKKTRK